MRALDFSPERLGARTVVVAAVCALMVLSVGGAQAACPAAPIGSPDDLVIRFPVSQGVWTGAASHMTGAIQNTSIQVEGVLLYDSTAKTLKLCDGTNWIDLAATGTSGITALTGDVTASGSGSVAASVANGAVTYAKIQNVSTTSRLLGRASAGAGIVEEITIGTGLSLSGTTLNASGTGSSGTAGYVQFSGGSGAFASDATATGQLFWDSTNHRLGIGTSSPGEALEVNGNIKTTDNRSLPNLVIDSISSGDNWTAQGAYISIGEGGALGSAAMHITYTGDGYGYTGTGTVTNGIPAGGYWRYKYNSQDIYTPGTVTATAFVGSGAGLTGIAGDDLGNHTATTTLTMANNAIGGVGQIMGGTWHATYDAWIQGGASGSSGTARNLALLGNKSTDTLYLNYATEYASGVIIGGNVTGGAFLYSSDLRLKENVMPLHGALAKLAAVNGVTFTFKDGNDKREHLGVIAQEIEAAYPQAVITGEDGFKRVDYPALVPVLIEAVKELQERVEELEARQ